MGNVTRLLHSLVDLNGTVNMNEYENDTFEVRYDGCETYTYSRRTEREFKFL